MKASARIQASVGFAFTSDDLDPSGVTEIMGLAPTRHYLKGEITPGKSIQKPWGCWAIEVESDDVEDAVRRLVEIIGGRRHSIAEVVRRYSAKVSVSIWWEPIGGQGGYTLPAELVKDIACLGDRVDFYFTSTNVLSDEAKEDAPG